MSGISSSILMCRTSLQQPLNSPRQLRSDAIHRDARVLPLPLPLLPWYGNGQSPVKTKLFSDFPRRFATPSAASPVPSPLPTPSPVPSLPPALPFLPPSPVPLPLPTSLPLFPRPLRPSIPTPSPVSTPPPALPSDPLFLRVILQVHTASLTGSLLYEHGLPSMHIQQACPSLPLPVRSTSPSPWLDYLSLSLSLSLKSSPVPLSDPISSLFPWFYHLSLFFSTPWFCNLSLSPSPWLYHLSHSLSTWFPIPSLPGSTKTPSPSPSLSYSLPLSFHHLPSVFWGKGGGVVGVMKTELLKQVVIYCMGRILDCLMEGVGKNGREG